MWQCGFCAGEGPKFIFDILGLIAMLAPELGEMKSATVGCLEHMPAVITFEFAKNTHVILWF